MYELDNGVIKKHTQIGCKCTQNSRITHRQIKISSKTFRGNVQIILHSTVILNGIDFKRYYFFQNAYIIISESKYAFFE